MVLQNLKTVLLILITIFVFWFLKFYLKFPSSDIEFVSVVLSISSILFGVLVGFFISELWTRYTEIRKLQGIRSSEQLNMINYASFFYNNKNFEKDFKLRVEIASIVDETIKWDEGHLEIPYFQNIEKSFRILEIKNEKNECYFKNLLDSHNSLVQSMVRMDTLYKERLFTSEWLIMLTLSIIIAISILFLDSDTIFSKIVIIIFPVIISLALKIVYELDRLNWGRELVTIEPIQQVFDTINAKRFYLKKDIKFIKSNIKSYRTENDLEGEFKKAYLEIINGRKNK